MNIIVDLNYPIQDGTEVKFRSPVDCSQVTGLKVNYPNGSQEFAFADAHGNNVGDVDHLFAEDVVVKVILDVTNGMAFVQNADTNAYLEGRFAELEAKIGTGGGGGSADAVLYTEQNLTPEQQEQARENIGAVSEELFDGLLKPVYNELRYSTTTGVCISATDGSLANAGNNTRCVAKASVKPNNTYFVSGSAQHGFAYWAFYDAQDNLLKASVTAYGTPYVFNDVELVAPENASYINVAYITSSTVAKIEEVSMGLVPEIDAVLYTPQSLDDEQKAQARKNIGSAPAKAIVDQSLVEEWDSGWVHTISSQCQFYGWDWKKYADGTFTLVGWLSEASIYVEDEPDCPLSWTYAGEGGDETDLPFDAYETEVTYWWEGLSPNSDFAEITVNVLPLHCPAWLYIEAFASAETRERMRAEGMEEMVGNIYVSISGKWRVDE